MSPQGSRWVGAPVLEGYIPLRIPVGWSPYPWSCIPIKSPVGVETPSLGAVSP